MESILISGHGSADSAWNAAIVAAQATGDAQIILIDAPTSVAHANAALALAASSEMGSLLSSLAGEIVMLWHAQTSISAEELKSAIAKMRASSEEIMVLESIGSLDAVLAPESILAQIMRSGTLPIGGLLVRKPYLIEVNSVGGVESATELAARVVAGAVSQGDAIAQFEVPESARAEMSLSDAAVARLLRFCIDRNNIEDIFPNHDWDRHQEESAAASYHTLAATFLRLGDIDAANDCLQLSDRLEDSPRSLALKGIIAMIRGEVLGAVANMVSSLQQYELRKKEAEKHYQRFTPKANELEIINQKLHAGLAALNVRDNKAALEYFAQAVFSFDPFYAQIGVTALKTALQ